MRTTLRQAKYAKDRFFLRKPERLWVHYCFALLVVLCLMLATYVLNRAAVDRGLIAANGLMKSNEQVLLVQKIMMLSRDQVNANDADLDQAITQFEMTYQYVIETQVRSEPLFEHFFGDPAPLHLRVTEFLYLAKRQMTAAPDQRPSFVQSIDRLNATGDLESDLLMAAMLVSAQIEAEAAYFTVIQRAMLVASGLVLVAEALLIFLPAQKSVQSSLQKMRTTTRDLRASQSRLKEMNGQLEHMVTHDQLTGLPNRRSLTNYLQNIISAKDSADWNIILVGLDGFKTINDTMGHDYGDGLLIAVSHALRCCVDHENLVAHVGGDEFALISDEPQDALIARISHALQDPFVIKGRLIPINASIGYHEIGDAIKKPLDILADAEIALHAAKTAGGNRAVGFTQHLRDDRSTKQQLQIELSNAIKNGEIEPWFQPQVRMSDGSLHGAEVLARWRHPTRGLLTPDVFLPVAERAGLMIELDHAIWKSAMEQATVWEHSKVWKPCISLNAAPDTISDPLLVERFLVSLHRTGLTADQVIIEVLETTLINGKDDIAAINIDSLADCGIALELDDFGTGYASLSKLTQLPLSGIKLDRSLIAPLPDQAADSIVRAILALAAELDLHVVAEGVEEDAQAIHLNDRGCQIGQGYGFGKPMPATEFTNWLEINAKLTLSVSPDKAHLA